MQNITWSSYNDEYGVEENGILTPNTAGQDAEEPMRQKKDVGGLVLEMRALKRKLEDLEKIVRDKTTKKASRTNKEKKGDQILRKSTVTESKISNRNAILPPLANEERTIYSTENSDSDSDDYLEYHQSLISDLKIVGWRDFRGDWQKEKHWAGDTHVIEVLVEEPVHDSPYGEHDGIQTQLELPADHEELPSRIRIRSPIIRSHFGLDMTVDGTGFVIRRPFKLLFHSEASLRDMRDNFAAELKAQPESSVTSIFSKPSVQSAERDTKTSMYISHLDCLLKFIDTCLHPKLVHLRSETCQSVFFSELGLLFSPGDLVIDQDERQAYRVISAKIFNEDEERPAAAFAATGLPINGMLFKISCVSIDFNGKQLGRVPLLVVIDDYPGKRQVKALEVYPIRYAKDPDIQTKILERGKTFLETAGVRHMRYNGPTVDTKQHIESEVMVDFEEAFTSRSDWRPDVTNKELYIPVAVTKLNHLDRAPCRCCRHDVIPLKPDPDWIRTNALLNRLYEQESPQQVRGRAVPSVVIVARDLKDFTAGYASLTEDEIQILSFRVFGFVLQSRQWGEKTTACPFRPRLSFFQR